MRADVRGAKVTRLGFQKVMGATFAWWGASFLGGVFILICARLADKTGNRRPEGISGGPWGSSSSSFLRGLALPVGMGGWAHAEIIDREDCEERS